MVGDRLPGGGLRRNAGPADRRARRADAWAPRSSPRPLSPSSPPCSRTVLSATRPSVPGAQSPARPGLPAFCSAASSPSGLGWEWVLWVNVPVAAIALALDARAGPGEPLGVGHPPLRCCQERQHHRRTLAPRLRPPRRQQLWLGVDGDRQPAGSVGGPDRALRRNRAPLEGAAGSLQDLPPEDADRGKRRRSAAWRVALLDVLFPFPVHAAGARLQRDSCRPVVPAAGGDDHHRVGPGWPSSSPGLASSRSWRVASPSSRWACSGSARCPSVADSSPTFSARRSSGPSGSDSGS